MDQLSPGTAASTPTHSKYKVTMCRDVSNGGFCPRGNNCTFAHSEDEMERHRAMQMANPATVNGNFVIPLIQITPPSMQMTTPLQATSNVLGPALIYHPIIPAQTMPPSNVQPPDNMYGVPLQHPAVPALPMSDMLQREAMESNFPMLQNQINVNQNGQAYFSNYGGMTGLHEDNSATASHFPTVKYPMYQTVPASDVPMPVAGYRQDAMMLMGQNEHINYINSPHPFNNNISSDMLPEYHPSSTVSFPPIPRECHPNTWSSNADIFNFDNLSNTLQSPEDMFNVGSEISLAPELLAANAAPEPDGDDKELEEELLALERRIVTEFKSD